jgi:hypothetical protein
VKSNNRVIRQYLPSGATYEGVYEVYYDETGRPTSRATELTSLLAPDTRSLWDLMEEMRLAFDRPTLLEVNEIGKKFVELKGT